MQSQSVGLGIPSLPFLVEAGDRGTGLDFARIVIYRTMVGDISMQTISLDATAVAAAFTYSHSDWYTVGDEDVMEPLVAGTSSLSVFKSFSLNPNVPDFAYVSSVATVDSTKGTLTLRIVPSTDPTIEIGVIGKGVVNEVSTSLTINIACKNGHRMKDGMCTRCPVGTFNSLTLVKQSPAERWGSCKACKQLTSTVSEGSTSEDQCTCSKGYYFDQEAPEKGCLPCPTGKAGWCSTVVIRHMFLLQLRPMHRGLLFRRMQKREIDTALDFPG